MLKIEITGRHWPVEKALAAVKEMTLNNGWVMLSGKTDEYSSVLTYIDGRDKEVTRKLPATKAVESSALNVTADVLVQITVTPR